MHKSNEDCFYFLTSSCAKGTSCMYRHSPLALACNVICPSWLRGNCVDPACPSRHTTAQRPMISNGILCFYENTPMGCLKPDCTFIHSRPRMNLRNTPTIRPPSTNFINKDATKPPITNPTLTDAPSTTTNVLAANLNPSQPIKSETQKTNSITGCEPSSNSEIPSPIVKTETIVRRLTVPTDNEQTTGKKNLLDNNNNNSPLIKSVTTTATRSVIQDSPKVNEEEMTTIQSRLVVNRNVVLAETATVASRKVVQTAPLSSNRVVVSSDSVNAPSKSKKKNVDLVEQENATKKFKQDPQTTVDISFPCSAPSMTSRLLSISSKEVQSTNDGKPIRLNRDRLPATTTTTTLSGNTTVSVSTPSNGEKTSAGTGLTQDDERRTMRLQRFQKNPISPPRSIVCSSTTTTNTITITSSNVSSDITSSPNERKRAASENITKNTPQPKRTPAVPSTLSVHDDKNLEKQTNSPTAKDVQREKTSLIKTVPHQSVLPSPVRPRFIPQPILPPSLQQSPSSTTSRPRQSPSVNIKRPLVPVAATSQPSTKRIEPDPSNITGNNVTSTSKSIVQRQTSNILNEEDENQLLKLNEPADVVDTFALIDEALLEADDLFELM